MCKCGACVMWLVISNGHHPVREYDTMLSPHYKDRTKKCWGRRGRERERDRQRMREGGGERESDLQPYLTLHQLLGHFNGSLTEGSPVLGTHFCANCQEWRVIRSCLYMYSEDTITTPKTHTHTKINTDIPQLAFISTKPHSQPNKKLYTA